VHIAFAAIDPLRHLDQRHEAAHLEIPPRTGLDAGVARLSRQHRQPADLELRTRAHEEIGAPRRGD